MFGLFKTGIWFNAFNVSNFILYKNNFQQIWHMEAPHCTVIASFYLPWTQLDKTKEILDKNKHAFYVNKVGQIHRCQITCSAFVLKQPFFQSNFFIHFIKVIDQAKLKLTVEPPFSFNLKLVSQWQETSKYKNLLKQAWSLSVVGNGAQTCQLVWK